MQATELNLGRNAIISLIRVHFQMISLLITLIITKVDFFQPLDLTETYRFTKPTRHRTVDTTLSVCYKFC